MKMAKWIWEKGEQRPDTYVDFYDTFLYEKECELDKLSDVTVHAPHTDTAHIQELHLPIYHAFCAHVEKEIFG